MSRPECERPGETSLPVLIAGGGIAGFATALALAKAGFACHLYEKRHGETEEGAGLQIGPNGTRLLLRLGVADGLAARAAAPEAIEVRDGASGRILQTLPLGAWIARRHGAPYWVLHRQDLHAALRGAAMASPLVTVTEGVEVTGATNRPDGVTATVGHGAIVHGHALVAADGVWSRLRTAIPCARKPGFTGTLALRTVIAAEHAPPALARDRIGLWLAPGVHAVHYPVRGGADISLVVVRRDETGAAGEHWGRATGAAEAMTGLAPFGTVLRDLAAAAPGWTSWPLYGLDPLPIWTSGHIALIGDAAHAMAPHLAQGAVMALEDAVMLATCLERATPEAGGIAAALEAYAEARQARTRRVAGLSGTMGRIYRAPAPIALARNLALRAIPGTRVMASYDWLYGYGRDGGFGR